MDRVSIEGLQLQSLIGVYDFERHAKQRVVADVVLYTDLHAAGLSDDVSDTLDYGAVASRLAQIADEASFKLLEALAREMVDTIFAEFAVVKLELKLSKPDILDNAENVGITLFRERAKSKVVTIEKAAQSNE